MYNHAPPDYICPFCLFVAGIENERVLSKQTDLICRDQLTTAFIAAKQWPTTPGHVLIVPNAHYENLYDLPDAAGAAIAALSRRIAVAMKEAYGCAGVSTRQHNEPAGYQDVWHYHLHVFPRYNGDDLYHQTGSYMLPETRASYAARLRPILEGNT